MESVSTVHFISPPPSAFSTAADRARLLAVLLPGYSVVDDGGRVAPVGAFPILVGFPAPCWASQ